MAEVIDIPLPPNPVDVQIADFRSQHGAVLMDKGHPEHSLRLSQLSTLYQHKFGGGEVSAQPDAKPDPKPDLVGGNQPADDLARLVEPAQQPTDYDFSKVQTPFGVEVQKDTELERWSREWLHAGGISPAEGQALATVYAESLAWTPDQVARMGEQTERDLRAKYGADVGKAAQAALKVADEMPELRVFLEDNSLINHPRVIENLIKTAERKGYFKRSAA